MIKAFDVAYFMISVDTLEDNTAFAKKENANFPLLADPTKETGRKYGVLRSMGTIGEVAQRWTFYIGPDGKILEIDKKVNPAQAGEVISAKLKGFNTPAAKR